MLAIIDELGPDPQIIDLDDEDGVGHLWCCKKDEALCGTELNVDEEDHYIPDNELCIVCYELDKLPCPHCGYKHED